MSLFGSGGVQETGQGRERRREDRQAGDNRKQGEREDDDTFSQPTMKTSAEDDAIDERQTAGAGSIVHFLRESLQMTTSVNLS